MIHIQNLNSKAAKEIVINEDDLIARLDFLVHIASETPVYLVSPQTMDEAYPPQKRRGLNKENVERLLNDYNEKK